MPQPSVLSVEPRRVYAHTKAVTVRGTGFLPRAHLACLFGAGNASSPLVYASRSLATCALPRVGALAPAAWSVLVAFAGQPPTPSPIEMIVAPGLVSGIRPTYAGMGGGGAVTVDGAGFDGEEAGLVCSFGGSKAAATVLSPHAVRI